MARLKTIWRDKNTILGTKVKLLRALVISIMLYACEAWTLTADLQRRIQAVEIRCLRRLLGISYNDHVTNDEVRRRVNQQVPHYENILTTVKKRKLRWYVHKTRSEALAKTILHGAQSKGRGDGAGRCISGPTTSGNGQEKASRSPKQLPTTASGGNNWFTVRPACSAPTTLEGYGTSDQWQVSYVHITKVARSSANIETVTRSSTFKK